MNFHPYYQTLFVVWGNQILFWCSTILTFGITSLPYTLLFFIIALYTYGCLSESTIHRYLTHKSYKTSKFKEKLIIYLSTFVGQGAALSWVAVHRNHHAFEDTPKDPHSPLYHPKWKIFFGLFPRQEFKIGIVADLIRSPFKKYFIFENKNYWIIWILIWAVSYMINFYLFYFIVSGSALWYICTQIVNIFCHQASGKKKYPNAVGINSTIINIITGAGHHNNHHGNPGSYTYKKDKEIDIYGTFIKYVLKTD